MPAHHFRATLLRGLHLLLAVAAPPGCGKTAPSGAEAEATRLTPILRDVSTSVGLHFLHDTGPAGRYELPEIMGSGCALLDYDNDGRLDIYLVQNGGPDGPRNQLFHQEPDGTFRDVSAGSGLDVAGYGMGVAVGDVNNDGYPDVLVTEYGRVRLFLNNGNGTFTDVTKDAGLEQQPGSATKPWFTSAAFFDYDRDGWLDLALVQYVVYDPARACTDKTGKPDYCSPGVFPGAVTRLYHNMGGKKGSREGSGFGVQGSGKAAFGAQASSSSSSLNPEPRTLNPSFEDVTLASGLGATSGPGLGVVCLDFDGDGWPDILVANDGQPNRLWINHHDGTFTDEATRRGLAYDGFGQAQANMGIAVGDADGGGLLDVFITHLTEQSNTFWAESPGGVFTDVTAPRGLKSPRWHATGFGVIFADFRNNGALDLAVVNGRVVRAAQESSRVPSSADQSTQSAYWLPYAERNQLFANDGTGNFADVSEANRDFCASPNVGRGLAAGDVFNDGGVDLLASTAGGPASLYRNIATARGHWLTVRAVDPGLGGRDAYGARITTTIAGHRRTAWINPTGSYLSSGDPRVHFGLGSADHIDRAAVLWPDGAEDSFPASSADRVLVLHRGTGIASGESK